jgi:hypothetical protein
VTQSHISNTAAGAVTLVVAAPVIISMVSLISFLWPVVPILAVSSICLSVNDPKKSNDNNNGKGV